MPLLSLHTVRGILYFLYMSHTWPLLFPLPAIKWFPFSNSNDSRVLQLLAVFTVSAALQLQLLWFFDSGFAPSGRPYPNIFSCQSRTNSLPTSRWLEQQLEVLFQWKDNVLGPTFVMRHHTCLRIDLAEGWLDGLRCRCTDRCRFEQDCLQRFEVGFTVNAPHVLLLWPLKPPGSTLSWH